MINRNNYEEYLLMYLDGELSPSERISVELFLDENPDLKNELELLQQTFLQPEEISFTGKDSLYRKEEGINLHNYQEYFLLYIDSELTSSEKEAVETFVLQQPQLQDEFTLLKQTVLPAEQVVFTDKQSLYRKEEKRRPVVISLRWASLAAAAMMGIVALVMFNQNNNGNIEGGIAVKPNETPATNKTTTGTKRNEQQLMPVQIGSENTASTRNTAFTAGVNKAGSNKIISQPLKEPVKDQPVQQDVVANNYKTQEQQLAVNSTVPNTTVSNPVTRPTTNNFTGNDGEEKNKIATSSPSDNNNNIYQPAVYTEQLDTEKDKTVYVGAVQVNPDKVRGFFRKASRFLSSKVKGNDDEDGKIKVANIEMNKIK